MASRAVDRVAVCLSSDPPLSRVLLRRASRIAGRLNSDWYCIYVQTPDETADRIDSTVQRHLVDNIQLAQSMGAEVVKLSGASVDAEITKFARSHGVTLVIVGQSRRSRWYRLLRGTVVERLTTAAVGFDVVVVALPEADRRAAAARL